MGTGTGERFLGSAGRRVLAATPGSPPCLPPEQAAGAARGRSTGRSRIPHAKVARPLSRHAVPRHRLFARLDGMLDRPVLWICGPAGCGKTTLIASFLDERRLPSLWYQVDEGDADPATFFYYLGQARGARSRFRRQSLPPLTQEHLPGLRAFATRYFDTFLRSMRPSSAIVFDNLQDVDEGGVLFELLREGLSSLPGGSHAILISRNEPPPAFARLLVADDLAVLRADELKATRQEAVEIVRARRPDLAGGRFAHRAHQSAEGWLAALVLLLESAGRGPPPLEEIPGGPPDQLFDYIASEVFDRMDEETRNLLLETSVLPRMTAGMAEALTGRREAGAVLAGLSRRHQLTERRFLTDPVYQYHPLFRQFLATRASLALPAESLRELRHRAGLLLRDAGDAVAAAALFAEATDWQSLAGLVSEHAATWLRQGRHRTLERLLAALPDGYVDGDAWLLYWRAASLVPFDPEAACVSFEKSFGRFQERDDVAGMLLACAGAIEALFCASVTFEAMDRWVAAIDDLWPRASLPEAIEAQVAAAMVTGLVERQPWRGDLETWAAKALSQEAPGNPIATGNAALLLMFHHYWQGSFSAARAMLDRLEELARRADGLPLLQILLRLARALHACFTARPEDCVQAAFEGLEIGRREGVRVMDALLLGHAIASTLDQGDWKSVTGWLEQMRAMIDSRRLFQTGFFHHLSARTALIRGDHRAALDEADVALRQATRLGTPHQLGICQLLMARALHACGHHAEARQCLSRAQENASRLGSRLGEFHVALAAAEMEWGALPEAEGLRLLERALQVGAEEGYLNTLVDVPRQTARSCARALEHGIHPEYAKEIVLRRGLTLDAPPYHLASWPWPVRVTCLGRFDLALNGEPLHRHGKVPRRPLLLLKALVAYGGRDVAEGELSATLWPDSEGDAAHSAFTTTLGRLRDLLGLDAAIRVQDGRVSLDPQRCWVDAWAFEHLAARAVEPADGAAAPAGPGPSTRGERLDPGEAASEAIDLYRGHFLACDGSCPWLISYRERLRSKFLSVLVRRGEWLERSSHWQDAVETYHRGLDVDDVAEELYQRLIVCYHRMGLRAEAIKAYQRCESVLNRVLGVGPSPRTESLYRAAVSPGVKR